MRTRLIGLTLAVALLGAGCDVLSPSSSPNAATASPTASGGPTAVAASATAPVSPSGSPTSGSPTPVPSLGPNACIPAPPTALSATWPTLQAHDGDYAFKFPADWEHLYGAFLFQTTSLLDPATMAETGIPAGHTTKADLVRNVTTGVPNASVLIVPGVTSTAQVISSREEARFRAVEGVQIRRTDLRACLGGLIAYGTEFTFGSDQTLQQSWYVVNSGRSYDFQWLAPKADPRLNVFEEMFRTWSWAANIPMATPLPTPSTRPTPSGGASASPPATIAPSAAASASAVFTLAGMSATVTDGAKQVDTKTFTKKLAKNLKAIFAVFALKPGLVGRVDGELRKGGELLAELTLEYTTQNTWGDFRINSDAGFQAGTDYVFTIRHVPSDARIALPFAIE